MRVRLESLGCRLNIGEMEALGRQLAKQGHRIVGPGENTDLFVFNTCAVTHVAARKSRKFLRQIRRRHPNAVLVATGCHIELAPTEGAELGVDLTINNADKDRLVELLSREGILRNADPIPAQDAAPFPTNDAASHTRAFVKVQDGCDNRCTFCIVTVARGAARSRSLKDVVDEIRELVSSGYEEAVLSGVHLGAYGMDLGDPHGLRRLLEAILEHTALRRLRLSSLEPWDLGPDFFTLWRERRLQPHLHLPLQSGCDATLRRMARRTTQQSYARLLEQARETIEDVSISTDIIVGFPGESDSEFSESLDFVRQMSFTRLHVFRYSRRQNTAAAEMPEQVEDQVVRQRSQRMHALGAQLEHSFRRRYLGHEQTVLWESSELRGDCRRWSGLSGNYLRVVTDTEPSVDLRNRSLETELVAETPGALYGQTELSLPQAPSAMLFEEPKPTLLSRIGQDSSHSI